MKILFRSWIVRALALLVAASAAFAQDRVPFRQEQLDQMLAPVALYPDALLSQVLMASTYPLEVVQAARWSRANPGLSGQEAVKAVEHLDWDPSVKSLTAFPQVISMMDEKLDWTQQLGEAFLVQQADVMNTVQGLRGRAEAAGNLRSSEQMRVARQGEIIIIEPAAPNIVYVPYYDPLVVYGPWWWPAYPPVYWAAPPAYYVVPAHRPVFVWGSGIVISAGFFFGHFDWPHRHVNVVHVRRHSARPAHLYTTWRHDPIHRRGVPFRNAEARQRFEQARAIEVRRDANRNGVKRPPAVRSGEHASPATQNRESGRSGGAALQPRAEAQPKARSAQPDRNVRFERSSPQIQDRRRQQRDEPQSQMSSAEPQIAPTPRTQTAPANPRPVAETPAARAEPRRERPPAAVRQQTMPPTAVNERERRAEAQGSKNQARSVPQHPQAAGQHAPTPRAAASSHTPRVGNNRQGGNGGGQAHGRGNQRERSSSQGNGGRRS
jgi:hypothetical protein